MAITDFLLTNFLLLVKTWMGLVLGPLKDPNMLWLLVPVYFGWFFTEFFQEKRSASAGNVVSNGFIAIWAGFDWLRTLITSWRAGQIILDNHFITKASIALFIFVYGIYVMMIGIRVKRNVLLLGRIRVVTYVVMMLTPIFYDVAELNLTTILAILLFFPLFYFVVEFIDWITPDPKALDDDGSDSDEAAEAKPAASQQQPQPAMNPQIQQQPYRYQYYQRYLPANYPRAVQGRR